MRPLQPPFELEVAGTTIRVSEHEVKGTRVFQVVFPNNHKVLTLMVGEDRSGTRFWTSIPEGRQKEAEQYGKLIAKYIRSEKNY